MDEYRIICGTLADLENAADMVDSCMDRKIGKIAVRYQLAGRIDVMPWDTGYITDSALEALRSRYVIMPDSPAGILCPAVNGRACPLSACYHSAPRQHQKRRPRAHERPQVGISG